MNRINLGARGCFQSGTTFVSARPLLTVVITGVALAALALVAKWALSTRHRRTLSHISNWVEKSKSGLPNQVLQNARFLNRLFAEAKEIEEEFLNLLITEGFNYENRLGNYEATAPLLHGGRVNAAAIQNKQLNTCSIGAIVNVGGRAANVCEEQGIPVTTFEIPDCDETSPFPCAQVADAIHAAVTAQRRGTYVFVNCVEGRSRSTAAIIAYLIKYKQMDYDTAAAQVQTCRGAFRFSNSLFETQLRQFQSSLV